MTRLLRSNDRLPDIPARRAETRPPMTRLQKACAIPAAVVVVLAVVYDGIPTGLIVIALGLALVAAAVGFLVGRE